MKKYERNRIIIGLASLLLLIQAQSEVFSQTLETLALGESCSFFGEDLPASVTSFASDSEADLVVSQIVAASGLAKNFEIRAAGVQNAAAVIQDGKRFILYNQHFMSQTKSQAGSDWAPISIMAHEVGHHLNAHTLSNEGSRPDIELQADYYSGFILEKMGASSDEARIAMEVLGSNIGSATHPSKSERLTAITAGWTASRDSSSESNPISLPQPASNSSPERFPPGFGMQTCSCAGFNPPSQAIESKCASGYVKINRCQGFCPAGGSPYAYVCM